MSNVYAVDYIGRIPVVLEHRQQTEGTLNIFMLSSLFTVFHSPNFLCLYLEHGFNKTFSFLLSSVSFCL